MRQESNSNCWFSLISWADCVSQHTTHNTFRVWFWTIKTQNKFRICRQPAVCVHHLLKWSPKLSIFIRQINADSRPEPTNSRQLNSWRVCEHTMKLSFIGKGKSSFSCSSRNPMQRIYNHEEISAKRRTTTTILSTGIVVVPPLNVVVYAHIVVVVVVVVYLFSFQFFDFRSLPLLLDSRSILNVMRSLKWRRPRHIQHWNEWNAHTYSRHTFQSCWKVLHAECVWCVVSVITTRPKFIDILISFNNWYRTRAHNPAVLMHSHTAYIWCNSVCLWRV